MADDIEVTDIEVTDDIEVKDDLDEIGPIDYIVVEFPGNKFTGEVFPALVDLVDRGLVRILDLLFIRKELDGTTTVLTLDQVGGSGEFELEIFEGAATGLVDSGDVDEAASVIEPGSSAAILVYENLWAAPFATAVRRSGGQLVASGRIPVQALVDALDALETQAAADA